MLGVLSTALLLLLASWSPYKQVHAETISTTHCIDSCYRVAQSYAYVRLCNKCAEEPLTTYTMCLYACGTSIMHPLNSRALGEICMACFADTETMAIVCHRNCGQPLAEYRPKSRLCWLCHDHGLIRLKSDTLDN